MRQLLKTVLLVVFFCWVGCGAWVVSQKFTGSFDPEVWKIVNGKQHLNYSKGMREQWIAGSVKKILIPKDDRNGSELREELLKLKNSLSPK